MKIEIKSVLGCDRATIETWDNQITLLAGNNGQGKSSTLNATRCVLLPEALPPGTDRKNFGQNMVHHSAKEGFVRLTSSWVTRQISYPDCEIKTLAGTGIKCDEISAGKWKLMGFDRLGRAKKLVELTGAKVPRKRFEEELEPLNIKAEHKKEIIDRAMTSDYVTASKIAESHAKDLKGEYKAKTGQQWYPQKAYKFEPDGWSPDLDLATKEQLEMELNVATKAYEDAVGKAAVYRAAGDKDALAKEVEECTASVENWTAQVEKAIEHYDKVKNAKARVTCAECGIEGIVEDGKLVKTEHPNLSLIPSADIAKKQYEESNHALQNATMLLGMTKQKFDHAEGVGEPVDVEAFRLKRTTAERRLRAFNLKLEALNLHYRIGDMLKAMDLVGPDGLAMAVLLDKVKDVNKDLYSLCQMADWGIVEIDRDLCLRYNGELYHDWVASETEQFKCDVIFQVYWTKKMKMVVMLVDRVDVLVNLDDRDGLFSLLASAGVTSIVAMATHDEAPDLNEAGIGRTYKIEKGIATALEAVPA